MSKLDEYSQITEIRRSLFTECLRSSGKMCIGPTNRGGIYMKYNNKEIFNDASVSDLRDFRDLIDDFLKNIVGE